MGWIVTGEESFNVIIDLKFSFDSLGVVKAYFKGDYLIPYEINVRYSNEDTNYFYVPANLKKIEFDSLNVPMVLFEWESDNYFKAQYILFNIKANYGVAGKYLAMSEIEVYQKPSSVNLFKKSWGFIKTLNLIFQ